jgi:hypothetical protein
VKPWLLVLVTTGVLAIASPASAEESAPQKALSAAVAARLQYEKNGDLAPVRAAIAQLEEVQWAASWSAEKTAPDAAIDAELAACRALLESPAPRPAPAPNVAGIDVHPSDLVRATIDADPRLRKRWRRGGTLVGFGIPVVVVGAGMFVSGAVLGVVNLIEDDINGSGIGLFLGGFAAMGAGGTMIGFGIRDRSVAKRDARRRLDLAMLPRRGGLSFGMSLRF